MHNWVEIQQQIQNYAARLIEINRIRKAAVKESVAAFHDELSRNWEKWKEFVQNNADRLPHLVPDFDEAPDAVYPVPENPIPAVLLSSDGSQIFPNRHEIAPLALISVSRIRIDYHHYKETPLMDSRAMTFMQEDFDGVVGKSREISFEDLVSDRRAVEELIALSQLAKEERSKGGRVPVLALSDGSLILWRLAERFEQHYESTILKQYLEALCQFEEIQIPLAGYISSSNSREIVHLVQLVRNSLQDDLFSNLDHDPIFTDTDIFYRVLKPGTRSTLFHSQSQIIRKKYGDQQISYFYLHVGNEIAKVEIPRWLARDRKQVDEAAAYCYHQARLGGGYPIVLSEAHEHAVVRGPDRETFFFMVEEALRSCGFDPSLSAKQLRKRIPFT